MLSGCDGLMIESAQGVRQGDPLSALLFCVYMQEVLQQTSEQTGVKVYGFFDDISLLGTPQQVMAALDRLHHLLAAVSLQLNTAKSHFTYFHDQQTPLTATTLDTLSANNIQLHHNWVSVVGAVVGRDDMAIRTGMRSVLAVAGNHDAFFRRVLLDDMPIQTAVLLLGAAMVPSMNYYLRCVAPSCIEDEARQFDERVMEATMNKLGLDEGERHEKTITLLQRKLRDCGWGLTSAVRTSPAAYLGSLAACHTEPAFAPYCATTPLPTSLLHGWVEDGLRRVRQAAPGSAYQTEVEPLLPVTASSFFTHYSTADPSVTTTLQRSLNAKANQHTIEAAVHRMTEQKRRGDRWEWAHNRAISANGAWGWKVVQPENPQLRLSDVEYAVAARLSLRLQPFPVRSMDGLPDHCPLCRQARTGEPVSLRADPWHWLGCSDMKNGEIRRRHDAVVNAVGPVAWQVGAQVMREVEGLDPNSRQRPDLQIVDWPYAFDGRGRITLADGICGGTRRLVRGTCAVDEEQKVLGGGGSTWCRAAQRLRRRDWRHGDWRLQAGSGRG